MTDHCKGLWHRADLQVEKGFLQKTFAKIILIDHSDNYTNWVSKNISAYLRAHSVKAVIAIISTICLFNLIIKYDFTLQFDIT